MIRESETVVLLGGEEGILESTGTIIIVFVLLQSLAFLLKSPVFLSNAWVIPPPKGGLSLGFTHAWMQGSP